MDLDTELARELERAIPHLPTAPASSHLTAGRRARRRRHVVRRRRRHRSARDSPPAQPCRRSVARPRREPTDTDSRTRPRLYRAIPSWAQEYGNHGPVSIYPDGRLWVAPDARLIRSVENPLDTDDADVVSSYAVEAEMDGEIDWLFVYRDRTTSVFGEMGHPGDWTNDFEVWIEDVTSNLEHRPSLAERLVHFAGDGSERLVAGPGAVIVDQTADVVVPNWPKHPGSAVAEVTYEGTTWFVLAMAPAKGSPSTPPTRGRWCPPRRSTGSSTSSAATGPTSERRSAPGRTTTRRTSSS